MTFLRVALARLRGLFAALLGRSHADDELREEMESHLAMHIAENVRRGMTPGDARRAALAATGGMTTAVESVHERRSLPSIENVVTDFRYAVRTLRRKPGFTIAVVGTLALGIGANAAMFTIVNAVVLRPLGYPNSDRIISVSQDENGVDRGVIDEKTYAEWRRSSSATTVTGAFGSTYAVIVGAGGPEDVRGARATASYFAVLGVSPARGRIFTPEEDRPGGPPLVVLSDQLWHSAFNGDSAILGKTIQLDGTLTTVIGIMPATFTTTRRFLFWTPYRIAPMPGGGTWFFSVVARLRDGATLDAARAELTTVMRRVEAAHQPGSKGFTPKGLRPVVMTLHDRRYGDSRTPLLLAFSAVGVLLLMACANLANLSLARAAGRQREFAVRLALGAGRWRLVRYVLCESLVLSAVGATLGVLLAMASVGYFVRVSPGSVSNAENVHVDATVLAFTLVIAIATGLLVGLIPAFSTARGDLNQTLSNGSPRNTGSKRQQFVRRALVVSQLATALMLLTGAGLVTQTFLRVTAIDPGFRADHLLSTELRLPRTKYTTASAGAFFGQLLTRVRAEPGVRSASFGGNPLGGAMMSIVIKDKSGKETPRVDVNIADPDYFETIGATLVAGRAIDSLDRVGSPPVVVINATLARLLFPGTTAIGQMLDFGDKPRVVGVIKDVRQWGLEGASSPVAYLPVAQDGGSTYMTLLVRTTGPVESMETPIRKAVQAIDPAQPAPKFTPMETRIAEVVAPRRFTFMVLAIFAALAASIAAIGLYGVLAYLVAERTREMGIRVALGADTGRLMRLVLGHGMALTAVGVAGGIVASAGAVRLLRNFVYGMSVYDPWTFVAGAALLAGVAVIASYVPARRASRVDPMIALRAE